MSDAYAEVRDIAKFLIPKSGAIKLVQAVVAGIEMGSIQLLFGEDLFPIGGFNFIQSYNPQVGDVVWVLKQGADNLVLGDIILPGGTVLEDIHYVGMTDYGEPAWQNNWQNYGNDGSHTYDSVGFYKDPDGFVHLSGVMKNTSGSSYNTIAFTLPVGYRPDYKHRTPVSANNGLFITKLWAIEVQEDGDVLVNAAANHGSGGTDVKGYISLDGIRFMAAEDTDYERIHEWVPMGRVGHWVWDFSSQDKIFPAQWHRWDGLVRCRGRLNNSVDPTEDQVALISERSARNRWNKLFPTLMVRSSDSTFQPVRIDVQPPGRQLARVTSAFDNELLLDGLQWWADVPESYWTELDLLNGWSNYTSLPYWGPPRFFKDGYGVVHVRGLITGGTTTVDTILCTLPVDCRPIVRKMFPSWHGGSLPARLDVDEDGNIRIASASVNNNHLTIDPISFRANPNYTF